MEGLDGEFSGVPGERSESYDGRTESLRDGLGAFPPDITAPAAENRPTESDADAHDVELSELHDVEEYLTSQEEESSSPDTTSDIVPQEVGHAALGKETVMRVSPNGESGPAQKNDDGDTAVMPAAQQGEQTEEVVRLSSEPVVSSQQDKEVAKPSESAVDPVAAAAEKDEAAATAPPQRGQGGGGQQPPVDGPPTDFAEPSPEDRHQGTDVAKVQPNAAAVTSDAVGPTGQSEQLDPKKAAEIAEAIKDAKDNPIEFLNKDGTIQARWATPTTDTPESLKMAPPQKLTDVVAPVADKYVGVPVEDRQQVAKDFGALVDDLFLNNAEQAGRSSYFPQDELRLKLETAGKSGLEVTLHSVRAADLGHEDDLNEQKIRGVRIQQFDENGDAREAVTYRLYADGTVRRWDEGDITAQARIYEEEGIPLPLFSGMPPAEVRAIFTDQTLPAYVHWETHTLPNQRVAQNVLGTQNRPISKAEFARLRAALTQSAIAPGRLKPPFTGITM